MGLAGAGGFETPNIAAGIRGDFKPLIGRITSFFDSVSFRQLLSAFVNLRWVTAWAASALPT